MNVCKVYAVHGSITYVDSLWLLQTKYSRTVFLSLLFFMPRATFPQFIFFHRRKSVSRFVVSSRRSGLGVWLTFSKTQDTRQRVVIHMLYVLHAMRRDSLQS